MAGKQQQQKILVIVGPTASGKSALAVELAKMFHGEVISADSRQVYRGLDIGTAKITRREMRGVPHHLLDIASPARVFTAHDFVLRAQKTLKDIAARGTLPIVAGGTGFYVDALLGRVALSNVSPNKALRDSLERRPAEELFALLKQRDPKRAASIDRHNKRRLIRALEIAAAPPTGPTNKNALHSFDVMWIGLALPREELDERIARRISTRMKKGMLAEAKRLHAAGLSYKRMDELGLEYRHLARRLQGAVSRDEMARELLASSRQYAKRQMTYWRRNAHIHWYAPAATADMRRAITQWLGH